MQRINGVRIKILAVEPGDDGAFATCHLRVGREKGTVCTVKDFFTNYGTRVKAWHMHQRNSNIHRKFNVNNGLQGRLQAEVRKHKINVVVVPNGVVPDWLEEFLDWFAVFSWSDASYRQQLFSGYARRGVQQRGLDLRNCYIMRVPMIKADEDLLPYYNGPLCRRAYRRIYKALLEMHIPKDSMGSIELWMDLNPEFHYEKYRQWCYDHVPPYDPKYHKLTRRIREAILLGGGFGGCKDMDALAHEIWNLMEEDENDRAIGERGWRRHSQRMTRQAKAKR